MKIYLDIDETLINNNVLIVNNRIAKVGQQANYLREFLEHVTNNHDVFWLTTHCNGDPTTAVMYLLGKVSQDIIPLAMKIRPTVWNKNKVEAINLSEDFLWFDDTLLPSEEKILKEAGKLTSYIKVDLDNDPDFYLRYLKI